MANVSANNNMQPVGIQQGGNGNEHEYKMGLCSWHPDWLQHINNIKWFLTVLSICSLAQGIVIYGLVAVATQSIEKEFGISSKVSGVILACQHGSTFMVVTFVSFFGGKGNKPKWMGIGSLVTAIGAILFILPKLFIGAYHPPIYDQQTGVDICTNNKSSSSTNMLKCDEKVSSHTLSHVILFVVGQLFMGAGTTPHYTLGPAYLDENVAPKSSPMYLGIWFTFAMLGPALGFLVGGAFLKVYTDITVPSHLKLQPNDPRWVGAWWLGFIVVSALFMLSASIMILFPKQMRGDRLKREEAIKKGHLPCPDKKVDYTFKGYLKECFKLCFNKVFISMVLGMTVESIYGAGVWGFVIKVMILKFGVSSAKAGMVIGIGLIIAMMGGIMGGSCIMKKVKVQLAAKSGAKVCAIISLLYTTSSFVWMIPGCRNTNIAGVVIPYHNRSLTNSLTTSCNSNCKCSVSQYIPICGSDGLTYHSPCFAGCTAITKTPENMIVFGNCSCIVAPKSIKVSKHQGRRLQDTWSGSNGTSDLYTSNGFYNYATIKPCNRGCKNFYLLVIFVIVTSVIGGLAGIPHKIVVMRCVPDNKRSFALGMKTLIIRVFTLPAPVLIGTIVDIDCITWAYDTCGRKKHCLDYNIDLLSEKLVLVGAVTAAIGTVLYALGWWMSPAANDNSHNVHSESDDALQLMT